MFWPFLAFGAIAYTFMRLGALSVLLKVTTAGLVCIAFLALVLALALLWRTKFARNVR